MRRQRRAENLRRLRRVAPRTEITVDALILEGFPAGDRHAIGDGFALELQRAFSEPGGERSFGQSVDWAALDAGRFAITAPARPASVGVQVARAVFGTLRSAGQGTTERE